MPWNTRLFLHDMTGPLYLIYSNSNNAKDI